ncbi:MAG: hypothetical protein KatS3mg002_0399 [Candidatus Woesearchaeota archaeon]|nr:MAG: hypothetical protein KatS3mg002_0399 [Candidatus Woesearchaeota archaeon]
MIEKAVQVALETDEVWSTFPLSSFIYFGKDILNQEAKSKYNNALEKLYEIVGKYKTKAEHNLYMWCIITDDSDLRNRVEEKLSQHFVDNSTPIMKYVTNWLNNPGAFFCSDRDMLRKEVLEALGIKEGHDGE